MLEDQSLAAAQLRGARRERWPTGSPARVERPPARVTVRARSPSTPAAPTIWPERHPCRHLSRWRPAWIGSGHGPHPRGLLARMRRSHAARSASVVARALGEPGGGLRAAIAEPSQMGPGRDRSPSWRRASRWRYDRNRAEVRDRVFPIVHARRFLRWGFEYQRPHAQAGQQSMERQNSGCGQQPIAGQTSNLVHSAPRTGELCRPILSTAPPGHSSPDASINQNSGKWNRSMIAPNFVVIAGSGPEPDASLCARHPETCFGRHADAAYTLKKDPARVPVPLRHPGRRVGRSPSSIRAGPGARSSTASRSPNWSSSTAMWSRSGTLSSGSRPDRSQRGGNAQGQADGERRVRSPGHRTTRRAVRPRSWPHFRPGRCWARGCR